MLYFGGGWSVAVASVSSLRRDLCFNFIFFLLCVLMSFDILLVQSLIVIGISAILIYFLYQKKLINVWLYF